LDIKCPFGPKKLKNSCNQVWNNYRRYNSLFSVE
jgi:hypothetical protein